MIVVAKEGFLKVLGASSSPNLGRISSYLFIKWQKPANKCDSNMPKGTLNHLVLVNWKIYTNVHYLQMKRTSIHKIILDIFYSFSKNIERITPFNISFKLKWQKDWVILYNETWKKNSKIRLKMPFGLSCSLGNESYDPKVLEEVEDEPNPPLTWSIQRLPCILCFKKISLKRWFLLA